MKTLNELRAFCEGYRLAMVVERNFYSNTLKTADDWVVWDEYDINFIGADHSYHAKKDNELHCVVYPNGWVNNLPDPLHSFTIFGETE
jgi:hypothetical protein